MRPAVTFGRAASNEIRIGHLPQLDSLVSRRAGEVRWLEGRMLVTNEAPRLTVSVQVPGRPSIDIYPGDSHAVTAEAFDVVIEATFRHVLRCRSLTQQISLRPVPDAAAGVTCLGLPQLTDRQARMLDLYAEPIRSGGTSARSYQQVADLLAVSRSLVRLEMNAVWDEFDRAGVPMRLFDDKRDDVVDAWLRHDLRRSG